MSLSVTTVTATHATAASGVANSSTSFSPAAGSMVRVCVVYMLATNTTGITFTCQDSQGTIYAPTKSATDGVGVAYCLIFDHQYASAPGSVTVKVTASSTAAADCLIEPYTITGQAANQSGAATNSASGTATTSTCQCVVTTTQNNSYVFAAGEIGFNCTPTAVSGFTNSNNWNDTSAGDAGAVGRTTSAVATSGTATTVGWTQSPSAGLFAIAAAEVVPANPTHFGTASLDGSGTVTASRTRAGSASLGGSGTLTASLAHIRPQSVLLTGAGTLSVPGTVLVKGGPSASVSGSGTVTVTRKVIFGRVVTLTGTGTVTAARTGTRNRFAALDGTGTVTANRALIRRRTAALDGAGSVAVLQVTGGLVSGTGGVAAPVAMPGSSQVAVAPPGSSSWQWIASLGDVSALKYSFICPGGCDKMSMTVAAPAAYRSQLFNPGWQVKVTRGAHQVWYGKLDEPQYQQGQGWTLTAVGTGNQAQDFVAYYTSTWPNNEPDEIINNAIGRGLPWVNPGLNNSPYASQFWFGQAVDPASSNVGSLMNLICTRGGLLWYVNSQPGGLTGNSVSVFPLPTTPNRILVSTSPVGRTLNGDINTIFIRYQSQADDSANGVSAVFSTVIAQNTASVQAHGVMETNMDLSNAGVMTGTAAQAVGNQVLAIYQRASFTGTFQGSYGQLLNAGGAPVDPGTDQAGTMVRLVLSDFGYGGEVVPGPISFIVGGYEWDDFAQVFSMTAYQTADQSLSGLLQLQGTLLSPVNPAGG